MNNLKHVDNVIGTALSGAGPGIIVVTSNSETDKINSIIKETWNNYGVQVNTKTVSVENNGAKIL